MQAVLSLYAGLRGSWRGDVVAGVTVGVVALPLALAFGIATGLGAESGIITAIVAGIVAALLGGSDLQVTGPTGAMTVVLVPIVHRYGADAVTVWADLPRSGAAAGPPSGLGTRAAAQEMTTPAAQRCGFAEYWHVVNA